MFETDASNTEGALPPPRTPTALVYGYTLSSTDPSSHHPLTRNTEVWLFGLKPNTQYKATVYPQAAGGEEGQPQNVTFRTGTLNVVECLQPECSGPKFCPLGFWFAVLSCLTSSLVVRGRFLEEVLDRAVSVSFLFPLQPRRLLLPAQESVSGAATMCRRQVPPRVFLLCLCTRTWGTKSCPSFLLLIGVRVVIVG